MPLTLTEVTPGGPAERAGIRAGDTMLTIDGRAIRDRLGWLALDANIAFGQPRVFTLDRSGAHVIATITPRPATWKEWRTQRGPAVLAVRIVQFVILGIATFVAIKRPQDPTAIVGAIFLATISVFSIAPPYRMASVWRALPPPLGLLLWIPFLNSAAIGGWLCSFFALFPRRRIHTVPGWAFFWLPLVPGIAGHALYGYFMVVRAMPGPSFPWWPASLVFGSIAYVIAGVTILVVNYGRLADVNERRRIRVVMVGSLVGCLGGIPVAALYWQSRTPSVEQSFLASPGNFAGTFLFLAVPLSFAYAILRHRLFDIRVMIRQGVRYALARHALLALAPIALAVLVIDMLAHGDEPLVTLLRSRIWIYGSVAAVVALARAQRSVWLDGLDRRFFRERYNAQQLLRQIAEEVRRAESFERMASQVTFEVEKALHPRFVAVLNYDSSTGAYRTVASAPSGCDLPALSRDNKAVALVKLLGKPLELSPAHLEWLEQKLPHADLEVLEAGGVDVLLPCGPAEADDAPLLALGEKRSEEPYDEDDLELLMAIASNVALRALRLGTHGVTPNDWAPRGAPAAGFEECPECGACYETGTGRCERDGKALRALHGRRVLTGRYRLDRRLGQGGMGTVYAALDTALGRGVAAKLIRDDLVGAPAAAERFRQEARAAGSFAHPNVVTIHDFGVTPDAQAFLIMELLEGMTLREALREERRLTPIHALSILQGVVSAVDAAHRQRMIHRDLKPENIFLVRRDGREVAKVLDFGIAKFVAPIAGDAHHLASTGFLAGTPMYMAPEQLRGEPPSESWDIWALAVVTYEMLNGEHPFAGRGSALLGGFAASPEPPRSEGVELPEACAAFFARALTIDPTARPRSAAQFLAEIEDALALGRNAS